MERLAYYRIRQVGLDLSSQKVIELLAQAKMTILEQDKTKKTLIHRFWFQQMKE